MGFRLPSSYFSGPVFSFTLFYWVSMIFTGFYWVLSSFFRDELSCLLGFTGLQWVLPGFTGFQ